MSKGPVDTTMAYGIFPYDIGSINFITVGQPDGSVMFGVVGHRTSYPNRVLKLYGDLFLVSNWLRKKM
eukprot:gnl/Chilomastix_caulleri/8559.p1 GENE.gnl/Chilomastix_caulleri/8559~~gnl/Chilomastix_caulleri/8559.p1  ORF type:complete len:68 (-),score=20.99 gnl/Chilomastix_caulleri/8559:207-410(-)